MSYRGVYNMDKKKIVMIFNVFPVFLHHEKPVIACDKNYFTINNKHDGTQWSSR